MFEKSANIESKQLLTPRGLWSFFDYLQLCISLPSPKNEFIKHFCMFQKLANTALDISWIPIFFYFLQLCILSPSPKNEFKSIFVCFRKLLIQLSKKLLHLTNSDFILFPTTLYFIAKSEKRVIPQVLMLFCMFEKSADTAIKTGVDTLPLWIIFQFPTTLYLMAITEEQVLPRVFWHFMCVWEISWYRSFKAFLYFSENSWYSCQNSCRQLTPFMKPATFSLKGKCEKRLLPRF